MPDTGPNPARAVSRRGIPWRWLAAGLAGLAAGAGSAVAVSGGALGDGTLVNRNWSTNLTVGASAANPWVRARVARVGLLALTKSETVYFDRTTDEAGRPLRGACLYEMNGGDLPVRWWSVTLYDHADMLARNRDNAASVDATRLARADDGTWTARIGGATPADRAQWISTQGADNFTLTLRLYNPASVEPAALERLPLPEVRLVSCESGVQP